MEKKDYYSILGVDRNASQDEIRKAFRKISLKYHPDRLSNKSDKEKKKGEEKFKEAAEAYSILSDEEKKAKDIIKDGFGFDNYSISEAILTCAKAMNLYNGRKDVYKKMVINAMKLNHTWDESARIYIALYESINKNT